jgi:hypothetical protein
MPASDDARFGPARAHPLSHPAPHDDALTDREDLMHCVAAYLEGLQAGPAIHIKNLSVVPLFGRGLDQPPYLTLEEALVQKVARVTEVSESGQVPELRFENMGAQPVLLVDGEELVGAKQNRVLNLSILVGAARTVGIPVSCVEAGRWTYRSYDFAVAQQKLFAKARARKTARVSESLARSGSRRGDQSEVWDDIALKFCAMAGRSDTMAVNDLYEARAASVDEYARAVQAQPGQVGAVFAIDGVPVGVETFDAPATLAKQLRKTLASYALDALEGGGSAAPAALDAAVTRFLGQVKAAAATEYPAIGEGTDVRLAGEGLAGGALVAEGRVVHLAGFRIPERRSDESAATYAPLPF